MYAPLLLGFRRPLIDEALMAAIQRLRNVKTQTAVVYLVTWVAALMVIFGTVYVMPALISQLFADAPLIDAVRGASVIVMLCMPIYLYVVSRLTLMHYLAGFIYALLETKQVEKALLDRVTADVAQLLSEVE